MKNIMVVVGSYRKGGNTDKLADAFIRGYRFNCVKYLGWKDVGMVLAGNCGGVGEKRRIEETSHLEEAYAFGKSVS